MKWTYITNISYIDYRGTRLWCHALLIDNEPHGSWFDKPIRQIRGQTWGGLDVFTVWIDSEADVSLVDEKGGRYVMRSDTDGSYNMDSGLKIIAGDVELFASIGDHTKPVQIEALDHVPFGDEVDQRLFKYTNGRAYPRAIWTQVPETEPAQ